MMFFNMGVCANETPECMGKFKQGWDRYSVLIIVESSCLILFWRRYTTLSRKQFLDQEVVNVDQKVTFNFGSLFIFQPFIIF